MSFFVLSGGRLAGPSGDCAAPAGCDLAGGAGVQPRGRAALRGHLLAGRPRGTAVQPYVATKISNHLMNSIHLYSWTPVFVSKVGMARSRWYRRRLQRWNEYLSESA